MALTPNSIAAAAKKKAERAQVRVRTAEAELHAANEQLKHSPDPGEIEEVAGRTAAAEAEVRQAADELEVVKVLLDAQLHAPPPALGLVSGEGTQSLLPYLKSRSARG